MTWLIVLLALFLIAAGCVCAAHIPGVRVLTGAVPPRSYTHADDTTTEAGPEPHWDPDDPPCPDHGWDCLTHDYMPHPTDLNGTDT